MSHDSSATPPRFVRVALVGASTLKGKDVAQALEERKFPAFDVKLLDDDSALGQLEVVGDEMTFIQGVTAEQFEGVDFTFFASEETFTRQHWSKAVDAKTWVIDVSSALEDESGAVLRAPWLEPAPSTPAHSTAAGHKILVVADPAAIVVALLMARAQQAAPLSSAVATVLLPASENGKRGLDELHQQNFNLLSFQSLPKDVFDAQLAFNMLPRLGPKAIYPLEPRERRIARQVGLLLGEKAVVPALTLAQAPTFHGIVVSFYVETANPIAIGDFEQALAGDHVQFNRLPDDPPSNISAAGQPDILLTISRDSLRPNGLWLWAAADNFRVAAENAVEIAERLLGITGVSSSERNVTPGPEAIQ